jgi:CysZ protein
MGHASNTLPSGSTGFSAFAEGFATPRDGFHFMCRHPRLWRFAVIPILLNLIITGVVIVLLIAAATHFAVKIHPWFEGHWGWRVLEVVVVVGLIAAAAGLAMAAWVLLNGILCGHYHGKLARQVELLLGMRPEDMAELSVPYQIADTVRDLGSLLLINVGFLALNLIPVLGTIVGTAGALYFDSFVFGMDYLDFPLSLRGLRRAEKRAFGRRHRTHTVGLGAAIFLFNFVPVVGSVVLSTAAAGAVLLHRRLQAGELSGAGHANPAASPVTAPPPVPAATPVDHPRAV